MSDASARPRNGDESLPQSDFQTTASGVAQDAYQALAQTVTQAQLMLGSLTSGLASGDLASGLVSGDLASGLAQVQQDLAAIQQVFETQIQGLDWDQEPEAKRSLLRSLQVETHKQVRLLAMDRLFLQTARQAATTAQRLGQVQDRLRLLLDYCHAAGQLSLG